MILPQGAIVRLVITQKLHGKVITIDCTGTVTAQDVVAAGIDGAKNTLFRFDVSSDELTIDHHPFKASINSIDSETQVMPISWT